MHILTSLPIKIDIPRGYREKEIKIIKTKETITTSVNSTRLALEQIKTGVKILYIELWTSTFSVTQIVYRVSFHADDETLNKNTCTCFNFNFLLILYNPLNVVSIKELTWSHDTCLMKSILLYTSFLVTFIFHMLII